MKKLLVLMMAVLLIVSAVPVSTFAMAENDPEFEAFLVEINWSKEEYINYLESKGWSLEDFTDVEELGTPLSEEGVQSVMADFDLSREELNALLVEYGDIEEGEDVLEGSYLIFNEELYFYVEYYLDEDYEEIDLDDMAIFTEIGLTDEELERLYDHFMTLDFEDEAFLTQLESLLERLEAIEEFESASELDAAQIAELLNIFTGLANLFEIEAKYFLANGEEKLPLSLTSLITLETTNGSDLLIEFYNLQGVFLADILLTADLFGSEIIAETGKDIEVIEKVIAAPKAEAKVAEKDTAVKTVKGGKLPKTASNYVSNTLFGLLFALIGLLLFRRLKTASH